MFNIDPCLIFGISSVVGAVTKAVSVIIFFKNSKEKNYDFSISLETIEYKDKEVYVVPEMVEMAKQVSTVSFVYDFMG